MNVTPSSFEPNSLVCSQTMFFAVALGEPMLNLSRDYDPLISPLCTRQVPPYSLLLALSPKIIGRYGVFGTRCNHVSCKLFRSLSRRCIQGKILVLHIASAKLCCSQILARRAFRRYVQTNA